jgi:hypothetical protein
MLLSFFCGGFSVMPKFLELEYTDPAYYDLQAYDLMENYILEEFYILGYNIT